MVSRNESSNPKKRLPAKLGELLPRLKPLQLIQAWRDCAGPALLKQVQFHGIKSNNGELSLILEVKDPMWRQELEFQKKDILKRFCEQLTHTAYGEDQYPKTIELISHEGALPPRKTFSPKKGRIK